MAAWLSQATTLSGLTWTQRAGKALKNALAVGALSFKHYTDLSEELVDTPDMFNFLNTEQFVATVQSKLDETALHVANAVLPAPLAASAATPRVLRHPDPRRTGTRAPISTLTLAAPLEQATPQGTFHSDHPLSLAPSASTGGNRQSHSLRASAAPTSMMRSQLSSSSFESFNLEN